MKIVKLMLAGLALASGLGAADVQDWSVLRPGASIGTWADAAGSTLTYRQSKGPSSGAKALRIDSDIVQWGGVWANTENGLDKGGALRFMAKSEKPVQVQVGLNDSHKMTVVHTIRLLGGGWESFNLPVSSFVKADWSNPGAPKNGVFALSDLVSIGLAPLEPGKNIVTVSPLDGAKDGGALKDGAMQSNTVQDFIGLPASAYGPFADTQGSAISLAVLDGAYGAEGVAAEFSYSMDSQGWCGEWIRAGGDWKGQDWSKAKALRVTIFCKDAFSFQMAFNDANQNAYQSKIVSVEPGAWRTVDLPIAGFALNPNYQPHHAKKGAPLDLSNIETFNVMPATFGAHTFKIRKIETVDY